jgi:hypothetical protein
LRRLYAEWEKPQKAAEYDAILSTVTTRPSTHAGRG